MAGLESLLAGRTLAGRYHLEEVVGRGLFAVVFRATDEQGDRTVAVKVIGGLFNAAPGTPLHERLHREARAAAGLQHPNVVPVHDFGIDQELGVGYVVMDLLRGEDLAARLARTGRLAPEQALQILRGAAEGLAAGHRAGIVHGNVKPENIFLAESEADDAPHVVVLDFGIVRGSPLSPVHASPEQLGEQAQVSPASDVWSLGVVGFQMLTGEKPFGTERSASWDAGRALRAGNPELVPELVAAIARALALAPRDRFPDAGAMVEALHPRQPQLPPAAVSLPTDARTEVTLEAPAPQAAPQPPLAGESLATRLSREGRLPQAEALRIFQEAVQGLAAGHRAGRVHGDVRPETIWLAPEGGGFRVVVTAPQTDPRDPGTISPVYASPEQLRGEAQLTPASDVFSLGAVGYHLLAGEQPFGAGGAARSFGWNVKAELQARAPDLPQTAVSVVARALEYSPAVRFPEAGAMLTGLEGATPAVAPAVTAPAQPAASPRRLQGEERSRSPMLVGALVLLLFAAGAGAAFWMIGASEPDSEVEADSPDTTLVRAPVPPAAGERRIRTPERSRARTPRPQRPATRPRRQPAAEPQPDTAQPAVVDTAPRPVLGDPVPSTEPAPAPPDTTPPPPDTAPTVGSYLAWVEAGAHHAVIP